MLSDQETINSAENISTPKLQSMEIMDSPLLEEDEQSNGNSEPMDVAMPSERNSSAGNVAEKPSNEKLLGTAFLSFFTFACVQLTFSVVAKSRAMVGDSAAMFVDALTYGFNWLAEHKKKTYIPDPQLSPRLQQRHLRKTTLQWEIVPPVVSVTTLIIVTALVLKSAIRILVLDAQRSQKEQDTPNINLMLTFSVLNLALDLVNVGCFASADHAMGYTTTDDRIVDHQVDGDDYNRIATDESEDQSSCVELAPDQNNTSNHVQEESLPQHTELNGNGAVSEEPELDDEEESEANLNMCSAYTHVFADTLRSFAVIIAASIAMASPAVTPEIADASAAVIVSILIGLSLVPLFQGLMRSWAEYSAILAEERNENLLASDIS